MLHNNFKKNENLHFIRNHFLTNFFKELKKYKNDYQQYLNYIYRNYIMPHFTITYTYELTITLIVYS